MFMNLVHIWFKKLTSGLHLRDHLSASSTHPYLIVHPPALVYVVLKLAFPDIEYTPNTPDGNVTLPTNRQLQS